MENVEDDNINKRGSIVGGTNVKIRKGIQYKYILLQVLKFLIAFFKNCKYINYLNLTQIYKILFYIQVQCSY